MSRLHVELYGTLLGTLSKTAKGFDFEVNPEVFSEYQLSSTIMSLAVPLNLQYTVAQKKRMYNFFAELLPESRNYEWLAQSLTYDERNVYGMLRKYGKDIAGALTIYDPSDPVSVKKAKTEPVDEKMVRYLLENMPQAALANSPKSGKTSLGGVQGKIVLAKKSGIWHRVHYGYPSTHIVKPLVQEHPTMIYDEAFCMQMAQNSGLTEYPVWIERFDGIDALVIERYDRNSNTEGDRLHQEDFNQALGAGGSEKYQEYGGKVSAKRIAQTLARFGSNADVMGFASQLLFAIAIGNLDMHAKNVSILHYPDESIRLAPVYDQVPLRHQNTDGKMALAIGGIYVHANISQADINSELVSWRCSSLSTEPEVYKFINNCLEAYKSALAGVIPNDRAYPKLKEDISLFISNLQSGKKIGRTAADR
jgi:serine/threonine-protein kinase HipA